MTILSVWMTNLDIETTNLDIEITYLPLYNLSSPLRDLKIPKIIRSVANSENLCYSDIANARSPDEKGASYLYVD